MLGVGPQMGTVVLSANGRLEIPDWQLRGNFAVGTEVVLVFTDSVGAELGRFDGVRTDVGLSFMLEPGEVKDIPAGANFQVLVTEPGLEPLSFRYGTVVREEPKYPLSQVVAPEDAARQYSANFVGKYIGPMWKPMGGTQLGIHEHPILGLPPSMGPNFSLFTRAAARWLWPMNMDSVTINTSILNVGSGAFNFGKFNVIVCADYAMQTYVGMQFYIDVIPANSWVRPFIGDGPMSVKLRGPQVSHVYDQQTAFQVKYNHLSKTVSCYRGSDLTPITEWTDENDEVPHGEGFRYVGLAWETSLLSSVCEPTAWEARDGV